MLLASGCSQSAAQLCEDGSYCPEGTRCGSGDFCLVEEASCANFGPNAPCFREGGAGFCVADACEAAVIVSGRVANAGGGGAIEGLDVTGVDRVWMELATTDSIGGFAIDAVRNDGDLVLRVEGSAERPPVLTRRLTLGTGPYEINGNATVPLRVAARSRLEDLVRGLGLEPEPASGAVVVEIGRGPGNGVRDAAATLQGPTARRGIYFTGKGEPDFDAESTIVGTEPAVLFVGLEPGSYSVTATHKDASACRGAGDDGPDPILLDVRAGELTNAGWIICRE